MVSQIMEGACNTSTVGAAITNNFFVGMSAPIRTGVGVLTFILDKALDTTESIIIVTPLTADVIPQVTHTSDVLKTITMIDGLGAAIEANVSIGVWRVAY